MDSLSNFWSDKIVNEVVFCNTKATVKLIFWYEVDGRICTIVVANFDVAVVTDHYQIRVR
jgi:hypothetical protein